jgi:hypothetical protein
VNPKALYVAGGGIAAAAIAIFFIMGPGNLRLPGAETAAPVQPADLQVALREINVEQTDDQNADVQVVFTAYNPNSATILLETIHYTVLVDGFQMTSDDIGLSPEGFLAGQANTFTVVGNSTVTLRSTQEAVRNNLTASSWDSMVDGTAQYEVEGLYAYRLTGSNFQTNFFEREFSLTFP